MSEPDWRDAALCAEVDPDLHFPEKGGSILDAVQLCRSCAVREPCLRFALDNDERFGIWGGFSERTRRRMARAYRAGKSPADFIAEDDARFYARLDKSAEVAKAAAERKKARERAWSAAARAAVNQGEAA